MIRTNSNSRRISQALRAICAVVSVSLLMASPAFAQRRQEGKGAGVRISSGKVKRLALVIGNAAYTHKPLNNPVNDAKAMAQVLRESGFEVMAGFDLTKVQLEEKILQFGESLKANKGVGLFYYSGHGMQIDGQNFLLPVEFDIYKVPDRRLSSNYATNVDLILSYMDVADNQFNLIILDACRDNPFEKSWKSVRSKGLAAVEAPSGTFIAYATSPNNVASDGKEALSPYTSSLIKQISIEGQNIYEVFSNVGEEVEEKTDRSQRPWIASSLRGKPFCFRGCNQTTNNSNSSNSTSSNNPITTDGDSTLLEATFNYQTNKQFTIGKGEYEFVTSWSGCSNSCIYSYSHYIAGVANSKATDFGSVGDFTAYDMSSSSRRATSNEVLVLKNMAGYYALVQVMKISYDRSVASNNMLTIKYKIIPYKLSSTWKFVPEVYVSKGKSGRVAHKYLNNDGKFVIGEKDYAFTTDWSERSSSEVYLYNTNVKSLAKIPNDAVIMNSRDASRFPPTKNRTEVLSAGNRAVLENAQGKYAVIKVLSVSNSGHNKEVVFEYEILPDNEETKKASLNPSPSVQETPSSSSAKRGNKSLRILYTGGVVSGEGKLPATEVFPFLNDFNAPVKIALEREGLKISTRGQLSQADQDQYFGAINSRYQDRNALKSFQFALFVAPALTLEDVGKNEQGNFIALASGQIEIINTENGKTILVETIGPTRGYGNTKVQARSNALRAAALNIPDAFIKAVAENAR